MPVKIVLWYIVCTVVTCLVCVGVHVLRILQPSCEYCCTVGVLLYFTLDAGLQTRSQHSEGPATGHLDTVFPLVFLALKATVGMVSNISSCHYKFLM